MMINTLDFSLESDDEDDNDDSNDKIVFAENCDNLNGKPKFSKKEITQHKMGR